MSNRRSIDFDAVWREHGAMISRIVAAHEFDPELRLDLEQEIAVALWNALPRFEGRARLKTFVARIAEYRCFDHKARQARRPRPEPIPEQLADPRSREPAAQLERSQFRERLLEAVRDLPATQRDVAVLALEDFRNQEIAEILGISETNAAVRLNRAKTRLRHVFGVDA